jgi:hypothetical protein
LTSYCFASAHFIAQVCTAAGNLVAGNAKRDSLPCMFRFLSAHIAAGEFDPTGDVYSQLQALNARMPCLMPNLDDLLFYIEEHIQRANHHDNKLRKKGDICSMCINQYLFLFDKQLIL